MSCAGVVECVLFISQLAVRRARQCGLEACRFRRFHMAYLRGAYSNNLCPCSSLSAKTGKDCSNASSAWRWRAGILCSVDLGLHMAVTKIKLTPDAGAAVTFLPQLASHQFPIVSNLVFHRARFCKR